MSLPECARQAARGFPTLSSGLTRWAGAAALTVALFAPAAPAAAQDAKDVLKTYADIAHAGYEDSLITAQNLQQAVDAFLKTPSEQTLRSARAAWLAARAPYQQTEAYRFGNAVVDDWEGKVNAWPLDEGLIDYVSGDYGDSSDENELYTANVIANSKIKISGKDVDASKITKELIADTLQEAGGVEANVGTGYHVIEFLLWGQDTHGTEASAGARPATDFDPADCTGDNCERRAEYLRVSTELLIDDLKWMTAQWAPDGEARKELLDGDAKAGLTTIMTGLGSLTYGELAGERMKLGLMLHDPEEEHDCFSDNTHNSHYFDQVGIRNVYLGRYRRVDGSVISGASVSDLVKAKSADVDAEVRKAMDNALDAMAAMVRRAETTESYDQMIGEGNEEGNATVQAAIDGLLTQTKAIERAVAALDLQSIEFEGSDSLDDPGAVQ